MAKFKVNVNLEYHMSYVKMPYSEPNAANSYFRLLTIPE